MSEPVDRLLQRLNNVREAGEGKWMARCPAHEDRANSLSIKVGDDGRALVKCFAGCTTPQIMAALGMAPSDLFAHRPGSLTQSRHLVAETDYMVRDTGGVLHATHRRRDYSDKTKSVSWLAPDGTPSLGGRKLDSLPLYGSEYLADRPGEPVILCEGEKASQSLFAAGYLAVGTVTGAASGPSASVLTTLAGREVILWPDNDPPGAAHMARIARALGDLGIAYRLIIWPDAPSKGDAYDFLAQDGDVGALVAAAARPADPAALTPPHTVRRGRIIRAGDGSLTPPMYLIDGVLPKDSLASLVAKEASYKSFVAIGMAAAVHTGQDWAGHSTERAPVLYLAAEGQNGILRRVRAWEIANKVSIADLLILPAPVNFNDGDALKDLVGEIADLDTPPALIVVDTLARNFGGNENAAEDMGRFIAACDRLRLATGACVLIVHHENKLGGYRGSSAFAGAMDTMIEAKREGTAVTLACKKQKDDGEFEPIHLAAHMVELGISDRHGRPVTSLVLQPTDVAFVQRQRQAAGGERALNPRERNALEALRDAPDRKRTYSDWRDRSGLPETTFDRVRDELVERGLVRRLDGGGYTPAPESPPNDPQLTDPHPQSLNTVGVGVGMEEDESDLDALF